MTAAIKARGEIPFQSDAVVKKNDAGVDEIVTPAGQKWSAGKDVVLRYTNSDVKRIESELGEDWFQKMVQTNSDSMPSVAFLEVMVKHGAKKNGQPFELTESALDDIPIIDLGLKVLDASCMALKGKTAKEYFEEIIKAIAESHGAPDPNSPSPDGTL